MFKSCTLLTLIFQIFPENDRKFHEYLPFSKFFHKYVEVDVIERLITEIHMTFATLVRKRRHSYKIAEYMWQIGPILVVKTRKNIRVSHSFYELCEYFIPVTSSTEYICFRIKGLSVFRYSYPLKYCRATNCKKYPFKTVDTFSYYWNHVHQIYANVNRKKLLLWICYYINKSNWFPNNSKFQQFSRMFSLWLFRRINVWK